MAVLPFQKKFKPKTCINYFQKGSYAFNISELWESCACMTRINSNAAITSWVFENSLPFGKLDACRI